MGFQSIAEAICGVLNILHADTQILLELIDLLPIGLFNTCHRLFKIRLGGQGSNIGMQGITSVSESPSHPFSKGMLGKGYGIALRDAQSLLGRGNVCGRSPACQPCSRIGRGEDGASAILEACLLCALAEERGEKMPQISVRTSPSILFRVLFRLWVTHPSGCDEV